MPAAWRCSPSSTRTAIYSATARRRTRRRRPWATARAVAAEPSDHFAHCALAFAYKFRKDLPAFHRAAERALALNPLDGGAMAGIAMFTAFVGDWQWGCELMQRAMTLNSRHPGWYWFPYVADAYFRQEYLRALD